MGYKKPKTLILVALFLFSQETKKIGLSYLPVILDPDRGKDIPDKWDLIFREVDRQSQLKRRAYPPPHRNLDPDNLAKL